MTTYTALPGSVSHGTMRPEDLIPAFTTLLRSLAIQQRDDAVAHLQLCDEANATLDPSKYVSEEDASLPAEQATRLQEDRQAEDQAAVIDALFDALDEYAPDGHAFGAHEGDGADYGFWPSSLNDDWEPDFDGPEMLSHGGEPEHDGDAYGGVFIPRAWEEEEAAKAVADALPTEAEERARLAREMGERRSGRYGYGPDDIAAFKAKWPAHGLPDELNCVVAEFDSKGDLVGVECFREDGNVLDDTAFDGPALLAMVNDIQVDGYDAGGEPSEPEDEPVRLKLGGTMRAVPIDRPEDHVGRGPDVLDSIRAALATDEEGEALVEVARAAHSAEMAFATAVKLVRELYESHEFGLHGQELRGRVAAFLAEHD